MKAKKFSKAANKTNAESKDVFQVVTDRIISLLESGVNPWKKTWTTHKAGDFAGPKNYISGKPYRGINFLILSCTEFTSPYFLTMKQVNDKGGRVIQGSTATPIVFVKPYKYDEKKEENGEEKTVEKTGLVYKLYYVFNIEQTTLVAPPVAPVENEEEAKNAKIEICEAIVNGYKNSPSIKVGGTQAFYRPATDTVQMPAIGLFNSSNEYYGTLFHELVHSTGADKRLQREAIVNFNRFGSVKYSQEELIAEMGAAFLNCVSGITCESLETNSAAYIKGWLKPLKDDRKFVFKAAAAAQKAVTYILGNAEAEADED